jgi:isopentenyl diphosphate isomerase/L-lactate dehydrogenase-like FMN-dependent dehydrogenase
MPIFISPAGVQALVCNEGEIASARAARKVGTIFGLSQHATRSIEHVAQQSSSSPFCGGEGVCNNNSNLWYQSYILRDRARTLRLVHRAVRAGYKGIFLTVDSVRFGYREADARNGWNALPPPHRLVNYDDDDEREIDVLLEENDQRRSKSPMVTTDVSNDVIDKSKIYAGEEGECLRCIRH